MRTTKIRQNGEGGRYMVFLIQQDVVDGQIIETVIGDVKSYKLKARAENVAREMESEITRDRDIKFEIGLTLKNKKNVKFKNQFVKGFDGLNGTNEIVTLDQLVEMGIEKPLQTKLEALEVNENYEYTRNLDGISVQIFTKI
ncbi:hypothetical protein [uncultured Mediterranean phage]|nr:hypothetical protein [uncultured Mediterranean phage]